MKARVVLWMHAVSPNQNRVSRYAVEPIGKKYIPKEIEKLDAWLDGGWLFSPMSYYTNESGSTVIVLEHEV